MKGSSRWLGFHGSCESWLVCYVLDVQDLVDVGIAHACLRHWMDNLCLCDLVVCGVSMK